MVKYGKLLHGAFGEKGMCAFREGVTFIYVQVCISESFILLDFEFYLFHFIKFVRTL